MGNLRPFKLFVVAFPEPLKYDYFIDKTTKSVETILALELIWVAHGCIR
jgi:hypothetical protein